MNVRQAASCLPVRAFNEATPPENKSPRGSRAATAGTSCSVSVSVLCFCSVSGAVSETFLTPFLKRFTRSVETSDLYWRPRQLWGAKPFSARSSRPADTSAAKIEADFCGDTRNIRATSSLDGSAPSFFDATQRIATQAQRTLSGSLSIFGSLIASS